MTAQPTVRHKFSLYWKKKNRQTMAVNRKSTQKTKPQRATSTVDLQSSSSILCFQFSPSQHLNFNRKSTSNRTSAFFSKKKKIVFIHQPQSVRSIISNWNAYHHISRLLYRPRYLLRRSRARFNSPPNLSQWYRRKVLSERTSGWTLSRD